MNKTKSLVRVIRINLSILLVLIVSINVLSAIVLEFTTTNKLQNLYPYRDFPSVSNKAKADRIYLEKRQLETAYEPYIGWSRKSFRGNYITINQNGDRIHKQYNNSNTTIKNVAVYGGSTIWGTGCANNETIPAYLDSLNPSWNVNNYGESGFKSRQSLARLLNHYLQGNHFDLVVFYDGVNEINACQRQYETLDHNRTAMFRSRIKRTKQQANPIKNFLYFSFIQHTKKLINSLGSEKQFNSEAIKHLYNCDSTSNKAKNIAHNLISNWKLAHEVVSNHGGEFIAFLQPNAFIGNPNVAYYEESELYLEHLKAPSQEVYAEVKKMISKEKLPWVFDLTNTLDGHTAYYLDFCHLNAQGNLKMATKIKSLSKKDLEYHESKQ